MAQVAVKFQVIRKSSTKEKEKKKGKQHQSLALV